MALLWPGPAPAEPLRQSTPAISEARDVARVTVQELRKQLAEKQAIVVDVRDAVAFASGHIPGALHVPAKEIPTRANEIRRAAGSRSVVLYCSCPAEQSAAEAGLFLLQHGLERAAALIGGYPAWIHSGGAAEGPKP